MASLLYPDEDRSQWPTSLLPVDDGTPPVLQADPRADALGQTYRDVSDYLARQQAKSEAEGYWTGGGLLEGGHPTQKGLLDAIQQTGTAVALGTGAPGDAPPPSFTAYHGSPHSFDAFDLSKIGTGEGAQAYGHGMYLADAEGVARGYRDALSIAPPELTTKGLSPEADEWVRYAVGETPGATEKDIPRLFAGFKDDPVAQEILAAHGNGQIGMSSPTGHMYEVQVNADPEHFLDWDKPLSEQHPKVQDAINGLADNSVALSQRMAEAQKNNIPLTGNDVVSTLARAGNFGDPRIAAALQKAGIPGIRYLDAGSRGVGEGSRNSVVFDAATMEIIRKYGLAGLMAGGGAAALSGQQGQQQQ